MFEAVVSVEHKVQSQRDVEQRADNLLITDSTSEHVHKDNPVPIAEEVGVEAGFLDASRAIPVRSSKNFTSETIEVYENLKDSRDH